MKIRLLKPYLMSGKGGILDVNEPVASLLIQRKVAKAIVPRKKRANK